MEPVCSVGPDLPVVEGALLAVPGLAEVVVVVAVVVAVELTRPALGYPRLRHNQFFGVFSEYATFSPRYWARAGLGAELRPSNKPLLPEASSEG